MKKKLWIVLGLLVVLGGGGIWVYSKFFPSQQERKVAYWTDPMILGFKSPTPGKSPMGMEMVPVYEQELSKDQAASQDTTHEHQDEIDYYTCTMHPSVKEQKPGKCPICSMDLVPVMKKAKPSPEKVDLTFTVSPVKRQLIGVKYSNVEFIPLQKTIRAVGRVDYDERKLALVSLKVAGWIRNLFVDYTGQSVHKGQPLFDIYSPELVSAQEEYLLASKALRTAREQNRTPENSDTISSVSSLISASTEQIFQRARQRLLLWDLTEQQLQELEQRGRPETYIQIKSPNDGIAIEKMVLAGMHVEPGMQLYKIADLSMVWIYADVYEYELPAVRVGQEASVFISSFPGERSRGRITYIFPYLNPNTRTARIRIELPNRDGRLKPEMYGDVEIRIHLGKKLAIPESAVLQTGVRQIVFVDKGDGLFEVRFVKLGARAEELYEVKEGLQEGERVVSSANFLIDAESRVQGVLQRIEMATDEEKMKPTSKMKHEEK